VNTPPQPQPPLLLATAAAAAAASIRPLTSEPPLECPTTYTVLSASKVKALRSLTGVFQQSQTAPDAGFTVGGTRVPLSATQ
jgi:hypothetical protein